jgi:hypothetical protein
VHILFGLCLASAALADRASPAWWQCSVAPPSDVATAWPAIVTTVLAHMHTIDTIMQNGD